MNAGFLSDRIDELQNWNYFNDFNRIPVLTTAESIGSDLDFNVSGTNSTSTSFALNAKGGVLGTTAGANNDQVILGPASTAGQSNLNTAGLFVSDAQPFFQCVIRTGANITNTRIWAGLKLTSTGTIATDADGVFFIYDDAVDTNWRLVTAIGGVKTSWVMATPSPIPAVAINTIYKLQINVNLDLSVNADIWVGTGLGNSNSQGNHCQILPGGTAAQGFGKLTTAVNFKPFIGVQALAAAAKTLQILNIRLARKYT